MSHLKEHNITYYQHLKRSIGFSCTAFKASIIFLIHGIFPNILTNNGSDIIKELNTSFNVI